MMLTSCTLDRSSLRMAGMLTRPRTARNDVGIESYDYLLRCADCWFAAGRFDLAQECYNRANRLSPFAVKPYIGLGCVAIKKGLYAEACVVFELAGWLVNNG